MSSPHSRETLQQIVQHCGKLQHAATRCNTLQHPNINYCQVLTANCMALTVCVSLLQFFFGRFFGRCGEWGFDGWMERREGHEGWGGNMRHMQRVRQATNARGRACEKVFACESGCVWLLSPNVEQQRECVHQSVCECSCTCVCTRASASYEMWAGWMFAVHVCLRVFFMRVLLMWVCKHTYANCVKNCVRCACAWSRARVSNMIAGMRYNSARILEDAPEDTLKDLNHEHTITKIDRNWQLVELQDFLCPEQQVFLANCALRSAHRPWFCWGR